MLFVYNKNFYPLYLVLKLSFQNAENASQILYSKSFKNDIKSIDEITFLEVFDGVPTKELSKDLIESGLDMISVLSSKTDFMKSNSEARRSLKENSISVNKSKVSEDYVLNKKDLINDKYVIINKGKRNTSVSYTHLTLPTNREV